MGFLTTGNNFTTGDSVTAAKLNNAINNATLTGAINPAADDTYDLGAGATEFKDLYVDGIAYLDDISLTTARTTTDAFDMDLDTLTTGKGIDVTADALTSGGVIYIDSDSADVTARNLVEIINNNVLATGAVPLKLQNDSTTPTLSLQAAGNGAHLLLTGDPTVAAPADGELWFTGSALNFRNGSTTVNLLAQTQASGCQVRMSENQDLASGTDVLLNFDAEDWDTAEEYDTTNKKFTATAAGKYLVNLTVGYNTPVDGSTIKAAIYINGSAAKYVAHTASIVTGSYPSVQCTRIVNLAANDYIQFYGRCSGATRQVAADSSFTWAQIQKITS